MNKEDVKLIYNLLKDYLKFLYFNDTLSKSKQNKKINIKILSIV